MGHSVTYIVITIAQVFWPCREQLRERARERTKQTTGTNVTLGEAANEMSYKMSGPRMLMLKRGATAS